MQITQQMIEEAKKYAWENEYLYVHHASDRHKPEEYIGFWFDGEYILNPWADYFQKSITDTFQAFGKANMEKLIFELLAKNNVLYLNHRNCPPGWIYIGDDGERKERYAIGEPGNKNLICFGLNPSTASPGKDDPTIGTVRKAARQNGYDGWLMLNLYPIRYTDPKKLPKYKRKDAMQKNNMIVSGLLARYTDATLWAAWGTNIDSRKYLKELLVNNREIFCRRKWLCRGRTSKAGHPHHPLYVAGADVFKTFDFESYCGYLN